MLYNKWELYVDDKKNMKLILDESDLYERVSAKEYIPVILPGRSWIYFPRVDAETNEKYRRILLKANYDGLTKEIEKMTILKNSIEKYL